MCSCEFQLSCKKKFQTQDIKEILAKIMFDKKFILFFAFAISVICVLVTADEKVLCNKKLCGEKVV